jgi:hypothetical protein
LFTNGIPFSHQNIVIFQNLKTNTTFARSNHYNFIENGFFPWHFQSLNILKLMINISIKFFSYFFGLETHTFSLTTIGLGFLEGSNILGIVL